MKRRLAFVQNCVLSTTPLIAGSVLGMAPSQATTFAYSEGDFNFTNINQTPLEVGSEANTDALAIGNGGNVGAFAQADAVFLVSPPEAFTSGLSVALGENKDYLGQAESQSKVIGNFVAEADTPFSFDFTANLGLETSINNPPAENARASGDISFKLIDITNSSVLDFFSLTGNLETQGNNDFIAYQKSDNITLTAPATTSDFGRNQEYATASIGGSLQRSFTKKTNLTLVQIKTSRARVTAPEPSSTLALLCCASAIGLIANAKRKAMTSARSLKENLAAKG